MSFGLPLLIAFAVTFVAAKATHLLYGNIFKQDDVTFVCGAYTFFAPTFMAWAIAGFAIIEA